MAFIAADHPGFSGASLKFQNLPKSCPWHSWFICFYLQKHRIFYVISYAEIHSKRKVLNSNAEFVIFKIPRNEQGERGSRSAVPASSFLCHFDSWEANFRVCLKSLKIYIINKTRIFTISEHLFSFSLASSLPTRPPQPAHTILGEYFVGYN